MAEFRADEHADRKEEVDLFQRLVLEAGLTHRILTIRDGSGTGKSHLLFFMQHWCINQVPQVPVSRVVLDDLEAARKQLDPLTVAEKIAQDLLFFGLHFERFRSAADAVATNERSALNVLMDFSQADLTDASNFEISAISKSKIEQVSIGAGRSPPSPSRTLSERNTAASRSASSRPTCESTAVKSGRSCCCWTPLSASRTDQSCTTGSPENSCASTSWILSTGRCAWRLVLVMAGTALPDFQRPPAMLEPVVLHKDGLTSFAGSDCIEEVVRLRYPKVVPDQEKLTLLHELAATDVPVIHIVGIMDAWWRQP